MTSRIAAALSTFFGVGLLPKAPGTWGSLVAVVLGWFVQTNLGSVAMVIAILVVFAVGWWAAAHYTGQSGETDPGHVVIDEVAGQWIALLFLPPVWWLYAAAFALFRFFDIIKPWPVDHLDRLGRGGLRIMQDDVAAGIYALLLLQLTLAVGGNLWFQST